MTTYDCGLEERAVEIAGSVKFHITISNHGNLSFQLLVNLIFMMITDDII